MPRTVKKGNAELRARMHNGYICAALEATADLSITTGKDWSTADLLRHALGEWFTQYGYNYEEDRDFDPADEDQEANHD